MANIDIVPAAPGKPAPLYAAAPGTAAATQPAGRTPLASIVIPHSQMTEFTDAIAPLFAFDDLAIVLAKLYNRNWIDDVANRFDPKNQMVQAVLLGLARDPDLVGPFLGLLYRDGRCVDPLRALILRLAPDIETALADAASQVGGIGEALRSMQGYLTNESLRNAVRNSIQAYSGFSAAAGRLLIYKSLHDSLQKEQKRNFASLYFDAARIATDPISYQELVAFSGFIKDLLENVDERLEEFSAEERQNQTRWVDELDDAHTQIRNSLNSGDKLGVMTALAAVEQVLREEPVHINGQIVVVMGHLPLKALRDALVEAADASPDQAAQGLLRGAQLVDGLRLRLTERVNEHTLWQRADRLLWKVEQEIAKGAGFEADILFDLWTGLKRQVSNLVRGEPDNPSTLAIIKYADVFDDAWVTFSESRADAARASKARAWLPTRFLDYRLEVINRFYQIDRNLKRDCAAVAALGGPIESLLQGVRQ